MVNLTKSSSMEMREVSSPPSAALNSKHETVDAGVEVEIIAHDHVSKVEHEQSADGGKSLSKEMLRAEIKDIFQLSWPVTVTNILLMMTAIISIIFVGRIGEDELAGTGAASMYANIMGHSILVGLCSALDTFGAQSIGSKNYVMFTNSMQRGMLILLACCIPIAVLFMFAKEFLLLLGFPMVVAELASPYVKIMTFGLPGYALFNVCQRFMQTQGIMKPITYIAAVENVVHAINTYVLVFPLGMGYLGAAVANVLSFWFGALFATGYIIWNGIHKKVWTGFSKAAFTGWIDYLKLGIPGAGQLCAEWWGFEAATAIAAQMGGAAVAAQTILMNTLSLFFMVPLGISVAVATRAGQFLGEGCGQKAKLASHASLFLTLFSQVCIATALAIGRTAWAKLFTNSETVISLVSDVLPVLAVSLLADGMQCTLSGILRACGKQAVGLVTNVAAYWAIGLPLGGVFGLVMGHGLPGLFLGLLIGLYFSVAVLMVGLRRRNWDKEALRALERTAKEGGSEGSGISTAPGEEDDVSLLTAAA